MAKVILNQHEVSFKKDGKPVKFFIYNNLPSEYGFSIEDAIYNWVPRTKDHTARSLCDYILSKQTGHIALTEEEFEKLQNEQKAD